MSVRTICTFVFLFVAYASPPFIDTDRLVTALACCFAELSLREHIFSALEQGMKMATRSSMESLTYGKVKGEYTASFSSACLGLYSMPCACRSDSNSSFLDEEPHSAGEDGCISLECLP